MDTTRSKLFISSSVRYEPGGVQSYLESRLKEAGKKLIWQSTEIKLLHHLELSKLDTSEWTLGEPRVEAGKVVGHYGTFELSGGWFTGLRGLFWWYYSKEGDLWVWRYKDKDGKIIAEVFIAPSDTNLSPGRCDDCKDPIRRGALSLTGSGSSTAGMNPGRRISIYHKGVCINCPIE